MHFLAISTATIACFLYLDLYCSYRYSSTFLLFAGTLLLATSLVFDLNISDIVGTFSHTTPTIMQELATQQDDHDDIGQKLARWPSHDLLDHVRAGEAVLESWKKFPHPPELDRLPYDVPTELRDIIRGSLMFENGDQRLEPAAAPNESGSGKAAEMLGGLLTPASTTGPLLSRSLSTSDASSRASSDNGHRFSKSSHSITKALAPAAKMGALGWIAPTPPKEKSSRHGLFHLAKKTNRSKGKKEDPSKEETNLMKFLKEQKRHGSA